VPALVTGSTLGVTSNHCPCPTQSDNLFKQVPSWKVYVGGMNGNCSTTSNLYYDPDLNSPTWIGVPAKQCRTHDVPLGNLKTGALARDLNTGKLPRFAMVVASVCTSMTFSRPCAGGSKPPTSAFIAQGDQWLGHQLDQIVHSGAYRSGSTAVFVTWLTGNGQPRHADCLANRGFTTCHVATLVIAPSVRSSTSVRFPLSHYSLLKTTENLLGIKRHLGLAENARDMRVPFHL
jgi:hypothetical protein